MITGIDVSNHQGDVDVATAAECGVKFLFHKATEGVNYVDPFYGPNLERARSAGIVVGSYHFARPDLNPDPVAEANYFLAKVGTPRVGELLALDIESGDGALQAWVTVWLRTVEARVGFKPLLYSGDWFMRPHSLEYNDDLKEYGLWLAAYRSSYPTAPPNWAFWAVWQYGTGPVPGVNGSCDLDVANVETPQQLKWYGRLK